MTPAELAPYELAARILCEKQGVSADALVQQPHPTLVGINIGVPAWEINAEHLYELSQMLVSMKEAAAMKKEAHQ
jgi:hypothetical protein